MILNPKREYYKGYLIQEDTSDSIHPFLRDYPILYEIVEIPNRLFFTIDEAKEHIDQSLNLY